MCHADDSCPPPLPGTSQPATVEQLIIGVQPFRAAHAMPARRASVAVLVLPDGRGLHPFYARLALALAEVGVEALAIDLYGRTAGTAERGVDFVSGSHSAQLTAAGVRTDLATGVTRLRGDDAHRRVVAVGFCLGGRVSLLAATMAELDLAGAVAFYPQTTGPARSELPAPDERVAQLRCPVLTLFGAADELIPSAAVSKWRAGLAAAPVPHEVIVYPGAPHSFFDRAAGKHADAATDAARRLMDFLGAAA